MGDADTFCIAQWFQVQKGLISMTMKLKERVSAVFLFLVFGFAFVYSRKFPDIPKIIPTGITVLGCILSVMLFVRTFYMHYKEDENFDAAALAE